ncbi:MAG: class I SAM-dependent methyltransferase [Phycisphaeraceae bacterium]|nr:MAG: class I SAM-dependent methyltransferase [Phycisphaeraceae bacterium]
MIRHDDRPAPVQRAPRPGARLARHAVARALAKVRSGRITLTDGGWTLSAGEPADAATLHAAVRVLSPAFFRAVAFGGTVGAADSFARGEWACDDLTALCRVIARNRDAFNALDGPFATLAKWVLGLRHARSRNTAEGSRRNIHAHYDLSNEFFALWLDPSMMYSCAVFEEPDGTPVPPHDLERAQRLHLDRLTAALDLAPTHHLAEIGTGWGALALHAARSSGCRVTTTTISPAQARLARDRIADAGLTDRVAVIERDYRDFPGVHDRLVSVEMIEAVGHQFLGEYFSACARLLRPGGRFVLQSIVIDDRYYEEGLASVDFIKARVFPGSFMPCRRVIREHAARAGLRLESEVEIGPHYATTLREWRRRFMARLPEVRALGFDEPFVRTWEFYLAYCEAGFAERHLGDVIYAFTKPGGATGP